MECFGPQIIRIFVCIMFLSEIIVNICSKILVTTLLSQGILTLTQVPIQHNEQEEKFSEKFSK